VILLDTNVVSEVLRPAPDPAVTLWLNQRSSECAISTITILELRVGVAKLPAGKRRDTLDAFLNRIVRRFAPRTYAFDEYAADAAAKLFAQARKSGRGLQNLPDMLADLQIAGIVAAHGLTLATRNTRDFVGLGIAVVDPWSDP
jgi:predicted nucleic acid-binding protein